MSKLKKKIKSASLVYVRKETKNNKRKSKMSKKRVINIVQKYLWHLI